MSNLDGKDKIKPVPFDAHEQIVHKPHSHTPEAGYQPLLPELEPELEPDPDKDKK